MAATTDALDHLKEALPKSAAFRALMEEATEAGARAKIKTQSAELSAQTLPYLIIGIDDTSQPRVGNSTHKKLVTLRLTLFKEIASADRADENVAQRQSWADSETLVDEIRTAANVAVSGAFLLVDEPEIPEPPSWPLAAEEADIKQVFEFFEVGVIVRTGPRD